MPYRIATCANYHWVKRIEAATHGNGALKLILWGGGDTDIQFDQAENTVFMDDQKLVDRIVAAINGVAIQAPKEEEAAA